MFAEVASKKEELLELSGSWSISGISGQPGISDNTGVTSGTILILSVLRQQVPRWIPHLVLHLLRVGARCVVAINNISSAGIGLLGIGH